MRKVLIGIQVLLIIIMTGCLKDERYEDYQMGINVTEIPGVAFPQASSSPILGSVNSQTTPSIVQGPYITLEHNNVATSNVTVALQQNNALVTAASTAASPLTILPTGTYTISGLSVSIPAGSNNSDAVKITVPNTATLDPTKTYALGFTISSVDQGYTIAANQKNVVIAFAIKNKYDGIYSYVSGLVTRYTAPGVPANDALSGSLSSPPNPDVKLITTGANSVVIETISWHGGGGVGGVSGLSATVDPVTNLVTMASTENGTLTNWAGKENKYDPATKTFTLNFRWNPASTTREYSVVLKYKGPR